MPRSLPARLRAALTATTLLALCGLALSACANTIQDERVAPSFLEPLAMQREYPIYWLGGAFRDLPIISVAHDASGAYTIKYGNCRQGGESVCVTPLEIVTSPDNSFRPGGSTPQRAISVRGVASTLAQNGRTIEVSTGGVVVDVYADSPALAHAASEAMVSINAVELPGSPLPRPQPTAFAQTPLPSQQPPVAPIVPVSSGG
ncbi:MAG TPA: hypothetical protein VGL37_03510 [Solirubrobacteraceae bacterium]